MECHTRLSYQCLDRNITFTKGLTQHNLLFSARSQTTRIKAKEPRMEGRVFLVSGHESTTLNVRQCS